MEEENPFPALFIGHGSVVNALLKQGKYYSALRKFSTKNRKPDSVIVLSAHWETENLIEITSREKNESYFDNNDVIEDNSQFNYPPPGNSTLARSISYYLKKKGIKNKLNSDRGLDKGVWIPLHILYPDADIPVIQISLPIDRTPKMIFKLGTYLRHFRNQDILLIGSGNIVNNPKIRHKLQDAPVSGWARDFDTWVEEKLFTEINELMDYETHAPNSNYAVPTTEHFDPMFFVLGLKFENEKIYPIYEGFEHSTTSMRSFSISK
jgi:4,5-DOPA dioxygenase extradiol